MGAASPNAYNTSIRNDGKWCFLLTATVLAAMNWPQDSLSP
jgi:hypothetical protein